MKALIIKLIKAHSKLRVKVAMKVKLKQVARVASDRILVVRLDKKLGDLIMFSSFMRELKKIVGSKKIDVVVDKKYVSLFKDCPYVENVYSYKSVNKIMGLVFSPFKEYFFSKSIGRGYELALVPRRDFDLSAIYIAYFSDAMQIAYSSELLSNRKSIVCAGTNHLANIVYGDDNVLHEVDFSIGFLEHIYGLNIENRNLEAWASENDVECAAGYLKEKGLKNYVVVGPGAADEKRKWGVINYKYIVESLCKNGIGVLVVGSRDEADILNEVNALGLAEVISGNISLGALSIILKNAKLFIGNDSGLMHLAAAANTEIVEISCHPINGHEFHPNSPQVFGPYGVVSRVFQPESKDPCGKACVSKMPHCILNVACEPVLKHALERTRNTF